MEGPIIEGIGGQCPVQAEGWFISVLGRHRFYFRARGTLIHIMVTSRPEDGDPLDAEDIWQYELPYRIRGEYDAGWIGVGFARAIIEDAARHFDQYVPEVVRVSGGPIYVWPDQTWGVDQESRDGVFGRKYIPVEG